MRRARRQYVMPTDRLLADYCRTVKQGMGCSHCDESREWPLAVRWDELRGWICKDCDSALDEMFEARP